MLPAVLLHCGVDRFDAQALDQQIGGGVVAFFHHHPHQLLHRKLLADLPGQQLVGAVADVFFGELDLLGPLQPAGLYLLEDGDQDHDLDTRGQVDRRGRVVGVTDAGGDLFYVDADLSLELAGFTGHLGLQADRPGGLGCGRRGVQDAQQKGD
jgi:hypothetical protein